MREQQLEIDKNFEAFKRMLPELLKDEGKYAIFRDGKHVLTLDTFADALKVSRAMFDDEKYSIQKITSHPIDLGFRSRALHRRKV